MDNIIGPDCSFYQYKFEDATLKKIIAWIDFERMKVFSPFVIIRAGQNTWKDICFDVSWQNAKDAGLPRGSYWYYDSRATPQAQAEKWADTLNGDFGELPLWCDIEERYGGSYGSWKHWYAFIERLKVLIPNKEIGIYTGYWYWLEKTTMAGIRSASLEYFKQYPLWIANYGAISPLIPKPWESWLLWQYTDKGDGYLYGVETAGIDLNYFNGNLAMFNERFNLDGSTPPVEPHVPSITWNVTKASGKQVKLASID